MGISTHCQAEPDSTTYEKSWRVERLEQNEMKYTNHGERFHHMHEREVS